MAASEGRASAERRGLRCVQCPLRPPSTPPPSLSPLPHSFAKDAWAAALAQEIRVAGTSCCMRASPLALLRHLRTCEPETMKGVSRCCNGQCTRKRPTIPVSLLRELTTVDRRVVGTWLYRADWLAIRMTVVCEKDQLHPLFVLHKHLRFNVTMQVPRRAHNRVQQPVKECVIPLINKPLEAHFFSRGKRLWPNHEFGV